ncbi:metallophosphoesterase family protein [Roseomonas stagni]|uniref:Metallophosphoesterase family protein n=1 Tax=Falsiroseomonas algicola TaxID=2716930 RepID=A0A6M1LH84_9PROT|nr:metallophosphoesterase family protein [Falsiroseomonas algicola]NGM19482.1 metallophosphoesterase family protein [Falsiroseomonas algicola]
MRLGVIADIHGNVLALQAVLGALRQRGVTQVVDLGDVVSGPLWPAETLALLRDAGIPSLCGNHDRWVAEGRGGASDAFARAALTAEDAAWLGALPMHLRPLPGVLAFHARPADDDAYLLEDVAEGRMVPARVAEVAARLGATAETLILCAHSHQPAIRQLPDGRVVVNPGSVGMPAYEDPTPPAHLCETGAPQARFAVLEVEAGRLVSADLVAIAYDHGAAAARAAANGSAKWARWLATGEAAP